MTPEQQVWKDAYNAFISGELASQDEAAGDFYDNESIPRLREMAAKHADAALEQFRKRFPAAEDVEAEGVEAWVWFGDRGTRVLDARDDPPRDIDSPYVKCCITKLGG